ncbi:MAG: hypothetical protein ACLQQ4_06855 [Bacteroidia bacterium]
MKKFTITASLICTITGLTFQSNAQPLAFHQGSFQINVTEGNTFSTYSTQNYVTGAGEGQGHFAGCRDPFQLEYGLTNHLGIGLSSGTDYYYLNPDQFYGFSVSNNQIKATTTEFTLDCSYHFFETPKTDIAGVFSLGSSTASFKGNDGDYNYNYNSSGGILRIGLHGRFFILGHFGIVAMVSAFTETDNPQVPKDETGTYYSTTVRGIAKEFGICYRFKK